MKRLRAGLMIGTLAAVMIPTVAAAQCEGGTTQGGYYLSSGGYVPGGCAFTNSTTAGQLYPSGAQVAPSTNPAAGISRLPGQRVPASLQSTLLDTVSGSNSSLGPYSSNNAYQTSAGPGVQLGATVLGTGLLPNTSTDQGATQNTLTTQLNPSGVSNTGSFTGEAFNPVFGQFGNTTGLNAGNTAATPIQSVVGTIGLPGTSESTTAVTDFPGSSLNSGGPQITRLGGTIGANGVATSTGSSPSYAGVPTTGLDSLANLNFGGLGVLNLLPGQSFNNPSPAYSTTLPVAPAVTEGPQDVVNNPARNPLPPVPGRGGPTFVGEERPNRVVVE